jgi:hypothetical protein
MAATARPTQHKDDARRHMPGTNGSLLQIGAASSALATLLVLAFRMRRRRRPAAQVVIRAPLPPLLPSARVLPRRLGRDAPRAGPDIPVAWLDRDRGTSPEIDHTREPRAPEHA